MSMLVNVRAVAGANVVTLNGVGEAELLAKLADGLSALSDDGPLVIDLTDTVFTSPQGIRAFVDQLTEVGGVRLVCTRLSGRKLLRRCTHSERLGVFPDLGAALADRAQSVAAAGR